MIAVEGLSVAYGRTLALDDVTVSFDSGITGLFGPNGSGKSTLLRVVAGLLRPRSGSATLDGQQIRGEEARRGLGYVGHAPGLYRDLSVRENLTLFARLYGAGSPRVDEVLERLGLERVSGARAGDLSAGLSRSAAVARALVHDPTVLLLDEPYANLDDDAAALMSSTLGEWRRPGKTAIVATHGAKRVKAYADAGVVLRDGRVVTAGRYREAAVR